jgi:hypothetical protein
MEMEMENDNLEMSALTSIDCVHIFYTWKLLGEDQFWWLVE